MASRGVLIALCVLSAVGYTVEGALSRAGLKNADTECWTNQGHCDRRRRYEVDPRSGGGGVCLFCGTGLCCKKGEKSSDGSCEEFERLMAADPDSGYGDDKYSKWHSCVPGVELAFRPELQARTVDKVLEEELPELGVDEDVIIGSQGSALDVTLNLHGDLPVAENPKSGASPFAVNVVEVAGKLTATSVQFNGKSYPWSVAGGRLFFRYEHGNVEGCIALRCDGSALSGLMKYGTNGDDKLYVRLTTSPTVNLCKPTEELRPKSVVQRKLRPGLIPTAEEWELDQCAQVLRSKVDRDNLMEFDGQQLMPRRVNGESLVQAGAVLKLNESQEKDLMTENCILRICTAGESLGASLAKVYGSPRWIMAGTTEREQRGISIDGNDVKVDDSFKAALRIQHLNSISDSVSLDCPTNTIMLDGVDESGTAVKAALIPAAAAALEADCGSTRVTTTTTTTTTTSTTTTTTTTTSTTTTTTTTSTTTTTTTTSVAENAEGDEGASKDSDITFVLTMTFPTGVESGVTLESTGVLKAKEVTGVLKAKQ